DYQLTDLEKEKRLQAASIQLFKGFLIIVFGSAIAIIAPGAVVWGVDYYFGWLSFDETMALTLSWPFIVGVTVVAFVLYFLLRKPQQKIGEASGDFENTYSNLDQRLHHTAFQALGTQAGLANLETKFNKKSLKTIEIERPVFVTAIPRAGTTLLLELFVNTGEFVSHTYRDMPFLMVPLWWAKFSKLFKQDDQARERAHGDGMLVSVDSPEAFEEIIWRHFWPKHYQQTRIVPWQKSQNPRFEAFFREHLKKIVKLRAGDDYKGQRYISKNNLNVARTPYLSRIFSEGVIIVPFRNPIQHALSLLKQHKNFIRIHGEDPFARDYMRDIGHYDFGENLKPVDFSKWRGRARYTDPLSINFWLEYWLESYRYILELQQPQIKLVCYEGLCEEPEKGLAGLAKLVGMADVDKLVSQYQRLALAKTHPIPDDVDDSLLSEVDALYGRLRQMNAV
ncbi:MAG: sulfotransferase, partial [Pseudomonadales bacterium]|nr:sulfotransferase [Pseudomonadales bacterium]